MKTIRLTILLSALLTLTACGDDDQIIIPGSKPISSDTSDNANRNTSGPIEAQTRYEFPKVKGGTSCVVVHRGILNKNTKDEGVNYCIEWDTALNAQRWSCYQLYSSVNYHSSYNVSRYYADNDGSLQPTCQYPKDPDLTAYPFQTDPFKYTGYDHGHICPSADRLRATEANYQTFYVTNMQPQFNSFNAGLWEKMETDVRNWVSRGDTLYVCKGGTIDSESNILEWVNQRNHQQTRTSANLIPVPRYFFMAVLCRKGNNWNAMGYWVEHLNEDHSNDSRRGYAVSIDRLEQLTGLDFFCNLPDDVEEKVESTINYSFWNL